MNASEQVYDDEKDTLGADLRHFDPAPVPAVIKRRGTTKRKVAERSGLKPVPELAPRLPDRQRSRPLRRCAVALGYLPADLWPEWDDYVLNIPEATPRYGTYRPRRQYRTW